MLFLQQCNNLSESLKCKDNGRPATISRDSNGRAATAALPSFLTSPNQFLDRITVPKSDTRLRIFSGTANPALSQVSAWFPFCSVVLSFVKSVGVVVSFEGLP